jgi:hypothetical protein
MAGSLDDLAHIREKFGWAGKQKDTMDAAIDAWYKSNAYGIKGSLDEAPGWFVLELRELNPPPIEISLLFADWIHNLRSVLDHIAFTLTPNADERTSFPVVRESKNWRSTHMGRIPDFPSEWLGKVEVAQPFQYGSRCDEHPLYILHHLDIREKHRFIVPMVLTSLSTIPQFFFNRPTLEGETLQLMSWQAPPGTKLVDGTKILCVRPISEHDDLRFTKFELPNDSIVGIGPGSDLTNSMSDLPDLTSFVSGVVESLAGAFI